MARLIPQDLYNELVANLSALHQELLTWSAGNAERVAKRKEWYSMYVSFLDSIDAGADPGTVKTLYNSLTQKARDMMGGTWWTISSTLRGGLTSIAGKLADYSYRVEDTAKAVASTAVSYAKEGAKMVSEAAAGVGWAAIKPLLPIAAAGIGVLLLFGYAKHRALE